MYKLFENYLENFWSNLFLNYFFDVDTFFTMSFLYSRDKFKRPKDSISKDIEQIRQDDSKIADDFILEDFVSKPNKKKKKDLLPPEYKQPQKTSTSYSDKDTRTTIIDEEVIHSTPQSNSENENKSVSSPKSSIESNDEFSDFANNLLSKIAASKSIKLKSQNNNQEKITLDKESELDLFFPKVIPASEKIKQKKEYLEQLKNDQSIKAENTTLCNSDSMLDAITIKFRIEKKNVKEIRISPNQPFSKVIPFFTFIINLF